jgi:DNA-binding transcriptional LysR family regulator
MPTLPDELRAHACLRLRHSGGALADWSFEGPDGAREIAVSGSFIANDFPTLLGAAARGLGLAQLPAPIAAGLLAEGKLLQVLEPFAPTVQGMFLYYPGRRQVLPKLRAFIEHARQRGM